MKKILSMLLCLALLTGLFGITSYGEPAWPSEVNIEAEGGIVMDADSGAVLWGKNAHNSYYPASITKIMTALLVLEKCKMDEVVTFSHDAVYNVEEDSSTASISEGDQLTVEECLYALLLKSANEAANALAEHVAGSRDAFAKLMNQKAAELGCTNTHFANPSGLNDENHYTSPYDMALIARAAFAIPKFVDIISTTYHVLPPTKIEPDGLGISPGNKMIKKNSAYYYPGTIGGKTGYTSLAGNTLVNCAQRDGMKLITVVMKGTYPQYYRDTKALLDFGFANFHSLKILDFDSAYDVKNQLSIGGLPMARPNALLLDPACKITLPKTASFDDARSQLEFHLDPTDPDDAVAKVQYTYNGRMVGNLYVKTNPELMAPPSKEAQSQAGADGAAAQAKAAGQANSGQANSGQASSGQASSGQASSGQAMIITRGTGGSGSQPASQANSASKDQKPFHLPSILWIILLVIVVLGGAVGALFLLKTYLKQREEKERAMRQKRRMQRLEDAGYSAEQFQLLMKQRHSSYKTQKRKRRKSHLKFK